MPISSALHSHKSEHAERCHILGLILALRRDGCSHDFCSTTLLVFHLDFRFRYQLHVDDIVILAESVCDLMHGLTPAICWGQQRWCSWGMDLEKSVAFVFGPVRPRPSSSVLLSGELLHVVSSCRCSDVVMTSSLRWDAHFAHLISRGHWFFAQIEGPFRRLFGNSYTFSCSPRA